MTHRDEQWARDNFSQKYRIATGGPASEVEQQVIGAVWGCQRLHDARSSGRAR